MSQRVFDHREKFRGFEASGPTPFTLVSKRSVHLVSFARGPLSPKHVFWACYRFFVKHVVLGQESSIL